MFAFYVVIQRGATNTLKVKWWNIWELHLQYVRILDSDIAHSTGFSPCLGKAYLSKSYGFIQHPQLLSRGKEIVWSVAKLLSRDTVKYEMLSKDFSAQVKFFSQLSGCSQWKKKLNISSNPQANVTGNRTQTCLSKFQLKQIFFLCQKFIIWDLMDVTTDSLSQHGKDFHPTQRLLKLN